MKLFSNEIVFRGHPDKVCDQISGAILDECFKQDLHSRVGVEVCGGKNKVFITGEITTQAKIDVQAIAHRVLNDCGYNAVQYEIINNIGMQSPDIAQGVDIGGAGDNGMMFGYACNDTQEMLPTAMVILQKFAKAYDELRIRNKYFKSDGKAQITGMYNDSFNLLRIKTFTICFQNTETQSENAKIFLKELALSICREYNIEVDEFLINPTGKFLIGGFEADAGLTGRKIVVDAYQSFANVGGGCMNGKDATKVDFSGAHYARDLAKQYLQQEGCKWCEVQVSYAIGKAQPLAIYINSDKGTLTPCIEDYKNGEPKTIINKLNLLTAQYEELAKFGHFVK